MVNSPEPHPGTPPSEDGLRVRKKAKRRQKILKLAGELFNQNGFDATTMADIAAAADISPPTVFNYFGSKDNILSALLFEGTARERIQHLAQPRRSGVPFSTILGDLFCDITHNTMRIAGKRVWRYAESANIRRPNSEFQREFAASDRELLRLIRKFLTDYDVKLRSGQTPDLGFLAQLFYDRWTLRYFDFIRDDAMSMDDHCALLRQDARAMVSLLFADSFAASADLNPKEPAT